MPSLNRLFALMIFGCVVSGIVSLYLHVASLLYLFLKADVTRIVPPASQGIPDSSDNVLNLAGTETDTQAIQMTANAVNQKAGATDDTPPNQSVKGTSVTAIDGQLVDATVDSVANIGPTRRSLARRDDDSAPSGYHQIFPGTGPAGGIARDAAIEGTAYLTYTLVPNATYNVNACLKYCSQVAECVFTNLYYEFNNELLDFVFSEHSNLKCVLYGEVHNATEKTNFGGQQSYPSPAPLTYIQNSGGWAADTLVDPATPDGYELVFGPTDGANVAPGYMGFSLIDRYDVAACAALCNARNPDPNGGACEYFNIWRALVNGVPDTYTCAFYYIPTDASTADNHGQGNLQVTYSRGYRRTDFLIDGGFEGYHCDSGESFCFTESYVNWIGTSPPGGSLDATVFHWMPYAHSGLSSGLLGSASAADPLPGTLKPAKPLATVSGAKYAIQFFHNSAFGGQSGEQGAFVNVMWNNAIVGSITPNYTSWTYYSFTVTAVGDDILAFVGGKAPAWSFLDDIHIFAI